MIHLILTPSGTGLLCVRDKDGRENTEEEECVCVCVCVFGSNSSSEPEESFE